MWKETEYNFGNVAKGSTIEYTFEHNKEKIIRNIKGSCGCLSIFPINNTLRVVWKTNNSAPESYESFKYVYITYPFDEIEVLTLRATLV